MNKQNSSLVQLLLEKIDHLDEAALVKKKVFNVANLQMYTGWSLSKIYKLTSARLIPFSKPTNGSLFFEQDRAMATSEPVLFRGRYRRKGKGTFKETPKR